MNVLAQLPPSHPPLQHQLPSNLKILVGCSLDFFNSFITIQKRRYEFLPKGRLYISKPSREVNLVFESLIFGIAKQVILCEIDNIRSGKWRRWRKRTSSTFIENTTLCDAFPIRQWYIYCLKKALQIWFFWSNHMKIASENKTKCSLIVTALLIITIIK